MKTTTGHCSIMDSNLCTGKVSSLTPHTKPVWLCSSHIYQTWMNMNKLLQSLMFLWQQLRWVQVGSNMLEIRMSNDRWKIGVTMTTMTVRSPQGQPVPEELQLWQLRLKPSFEVFHNVWFSMCFHWGTNRPPFATWDLRLLMIVLKFRHYVSQIPPNKRTWGAQSHC